MSCPDDHRSLLASLGTRFEYDCSGDSVRIAVADGTEVEIPGPDLRQCLDWLQGEAAPPPGPYAEILERTRAGLSGLEARFRREQGAAPTLLNELLRLRPLERMSRLSADERCRTYSLARLAVERSRETILRDPALARELAELGRRCAAELDPQVYRGPQLRDLQAYAEAVYGNSLRVAGDYRAARTAFGQAREYLDLGSGDWSEELEIDGLEASLHRTLRDFPRALELSDRVIEGTLALGQREAAARALQQRSIILDEMEDPEAAIEVLEVASELAADSTDKLLLFTIRHGLAVCLARSGRSAEAARLMLDNRDLYRELSSPKIDGCRLWLEGLIALESSEPVTAIETLRQAREVFENQGFPFDTAQVSLDLAAALAELGHGDEVLDLAATTYAFLESREVHPDALAALAVLQQAAAREEVSRELLRQLARRLSRASSLPVPPAS